MTSQPFCAYLVAFVLDKFFDSVDDEVKSIFVHTRNIAWEQERTNHVIIFG